jgi:hypothetical protein
VSRDPLAIEWTGNREGHHDLPNRALYAGDQHPFGCYTSDWGHASGWVDTMSPQGSARVSVIMPVFNTEAYIAESIESVLQ